jgi:hypothetical protein
LINDQCSKRDIKYVHNIHMFLEIHTNIIDYRKRYLDLDELCKDIYGWKYFSKWIDKGDYLECSAGYMALFSAYYSGIFGEKCLYYRNSNNKQIRSYGMTKKYKPSDLKYCFTLADPIFDFTVIVLFLLLLIVLFH